MLARSLAAAFGAAFLFGSFTIARADNASPSVAVRAAQLRAAQLAQISSAGALHAKEEFANPQRAYPPSCLNSPIPLQFGLNADPNALQAQVQLEGDPLSGSPAEEQYVETDTISVWRVACADGFSAVLVEIDRPASLEGNTDQYPTVPGFAIPVTSSTYFFPRMVEDPNTFFANVIALNPLINSTVYVLEYFYGQASPVDYNQAFTLDVNNLISADLIPFNVPAYNPANYAAANQPLPISGYMSSGWYDPAHSGEGMFVQVYDNGDESTRNFTATWYTYDEMGVPFWLIATGNIDIGANQALNVPTYYLTNGGFAGNFGSSADLHTWGTISFSFPDCNTMAFTFSGQTGSDVTNGPHGNGTRTWTRVANVNGLVCGMSAQ